MCQIVFSFVYLISRVYSSFELEFLSVVLKKFSNGVEL